MRISVRGVTLVEMVVVIAITGVIAAAVAIFIRRPVEGYVDTARRVHLTETADTALRRITRDLRTALPNSIRITTTGSGPTRISYLEYLQTVGGGRYRAELDSAGAGNTLDFTVQDTVFDVIGTMPPAAAGNFIVVYNLAATGTTANAYAGDNRAQVDSVAAPAITLASPGHQFPFASPGSRFQVVQYPVTYACDLGRAELRRYWGYTIPTNQPTPIPSSPPAGPNSVNSQLAANVTDCDFSYTISGATQRTGVVALSLQVSQAGETVRMFQQVHVSNVP